VQYNGASETGAELITDNGPVSAVAERLFNGVQTKNFTTFETELLFKTQSKKGKFGEV
jgi:hypothetical protein